jgi:hypothetical protein
MASDNTSFRLINWASLVRDYWGPEFFEPDVVYRFSNGREFKDTGDYGGIYEIE